METAEILARYDGEMREHPPVEEGTRVDRAGPVVRLIGEHCTVIYSRLSASNAREVIAGETAFFRSLGREVEWKVYGHDRPANLGQLLQLAGYAPDPPETWMVLDLASPVLAGPETDDEEVEVRRVEDGAGLRDAVEVSRGAFGPGRGWHPEEYARRMADPTLVLLVAYWQGEPVASGRLELPTGRSFAGLWGGGTSPPYRGRGLYRKLVSVRAEIARAKGFRFLTVDALETSRPILQRLGFQPIDTITGWIQRP